MLKRRLRPSPPGDLVYLSERKLFNLAATLDINTSSMAPSARLEGSGTVEAGVPGVVSVSSKAAVHAQRIDPGKPAKVLNGQLRQTVQSLVSAGLANLEENESIAEGKWFRFHRKLRFGVGTDDSTHSVRALIAVDEHKVERNSGMPGLLMHGSPIHVLPPYAVKLRERQGSRSGSGTGALFIWLDKVRRALEDDPTAEISALEGNLLGSATSPRHPDTAQQMYGLFAQDDWLDAPSFPQLLHGAPCEGVAQASYVAVTDELALVMASPLFIRISPLDAPGHFAEKPSFARRLLSRQRPPTS